MEIVSAVIFQKLKAILKTLQEMNTSEEFQEKIQEAKNLLEQLISGIFQVVNRLIGWVDASCWRSLYSEKKIHLFGDTSLISKK